MWLRLIRSSLQSEFVFLTLSSIKYGICGEVFKTATVSSSSSYQVRPAGPVNKEMRKLNGLVSQGSSLQDGCRPAFLIKH